MAPLLSLSISHLERPWVHVNRVGMGSHGCRALSDRSPRFLSDFPNIHTPSLIFFPRVVPLFPCLLPLSPGLQTPPQSPYCVKQLPSANINPPRMPRGRDAIHFNQPTLYNDFSPIPMDHLSILLSSIQIPCDLLKLHLLICSALAVSIWDLSVWGSHSEEAVFQSVLKGADFSVSSGVCPCLLTSLKQNFIQKSLTEYGCLVCCVSGPLRSDPSCAACISFLLKTSLRTHRIRILLEKWRS